MVECPYGLDNCLEEIVNKKIKKFLVVDAAILPEDLRASVFLTEINNVSAYFIATTHNITVPMISNYSSIS